MTVTDALLKKGANVFSKDNNQRSPIHHACINYSLPMMIRLHNAAKHQLFHHLNTIMFNIPTDLNRIIAEFVGTSEYFHLQDANQETPLHILARWINPNGDDNGEEDNAEMCALTILANGNTEAPRIKNNEGFTPLQIAANFGHKKLVRRMLDVVADAYDVDLEVLKKKAESESNERVRTNLLEVINIIEREREYADNFGGAMCSFAI